MMNIEIEALIKTKVNEALEGRRLPNCSIVANLTNGLVDSLELTESGIVENHIQLFKHMREQQSKLKDENERLNKALEKSDSIPPTIQQMCDLLNSELSEDSSSFTYNNGKFENSEVILSYNDGVIKSEYKRYFSGRITTEASAVVLKNLAMFYENSQR